MEYSIGDYGGEASFRFQNIGKNVTKEGKNRRKRKKNRDTIICKYICLVAKFSP